jgi:hypothetical protein
MYSTKVYHEKAKDSTGKPLAFLAPLVPKGAEGKRT